MRRGSLIQLAVFGLIAAAICVAVALAIPWLPQPAGDEAYRTDFVFWFVTAIAITVFSVVCSVLAYSVLRFRARPDDDSDGPPTHGHTKLEIVWTTIPMLLLISIAIASAAVLAKNTNAGAHPLVVKVLGRQFAWTFTYPNGKTYGYMMLPKDVHTELEITASDVIHGFWVPQLAQKQDAVPGKVVPLVVTPSRLGTYPVICTQLCGLGHALMRSHVTVVPRPQFEKWLKGGSQAAAGGSPGLAVFNSEGCAGCHTFKAAGATGKVGPDLDDLKAAATKAGRGSLAQFVKESIVDPDAYVAPGFSANIMPGNFGQQIPSAKLDQLVQYLTGSAGT